MVLITTINFQKKKKKENEHLYTFENQVHCCKNCYAVKIVMLHEVTSFTLH